MKWLKAELHTHTLEDPDDGQRIVFHTANELIDQAAAKGFEVLAITNHNQMLFSDELQDYAQKAGVLLVPGVEATIKGKHVLLYNFSEYEPSWQDPEVIRACRSENRLVVAPHPFFPIHTALRRRFFEWIDLFDAVEYSHFYLQRVNFNRQAERVARRLRLPIVGNSDLHRLEQLGKTYSLIYAEKNLNSVISAIRRGCVRVVTQPERAVFFVNWLAASTRNRSRYALRELFSTPLA